MVDLVNNLHLLEENSREVLARVANKLTSLNERQLIEAVKRYGHVGTKKIFASLIQEFHDCSLK